MPNGLFILLFKGEIFIFSKSGNVVPASESLIDFYAPDSWSIMDLGDGIGCSCYSYGFISGLGSDSRNILTKLKLLAFTIDG